MKRCPECNFIYLDTDEKCDLDGSKLVSVAEADLVSADAGLDNSNQNAPIANRPQIERTFPRNQRSVLFAVGGLATIALIGAFLYLAKTRNSPVNNSAPPAIVQSAQVASIQEQITPTPTPREEATPTPTPSETRSNNRSSDQVKVNRAVTSSNPVSTTAKEKLSGRVVIRLTTGATIEAEEAWRTKEGVWYRRSGLVTLLKNKEVRSIEKR
jgi:hypothetical protein